ncbi:MAG: glycosyl transferase, group 1 family protein, partial [Proteobacteria bacterium]|nr:glycosyl transferase, group 1 family protein [Pseudomonadota bacterium]
GYYKIDGYYRHAHAWIGNTRGICDYLVQSGLPAERVFQIGNFVPDPIQRSAEEIDALRRAWEIPEDARVLFALGRLIEKKGFADLLRALARLPPEIDGRPWRMLIAGDGPLADALKAGTREFGLESHVRWLGWQDPPDACYGMADAFICPSRIEPLGNVILEAWNYGLPVISTKTTGALELIEDGSRGLLCEIGDDAGLADAILAVLSAPESDRAAIGAAGQAFLRDHFGREAIVRDYLALYERLTSLRGD